MEKEGGADGGKEWVSVGGWVRGECGAVMMICSWSFDDFN